MTTVQKKRNPTSPSRIRAAAVALTVLFAILAARMWYLQIAKGDYYFDRATRNSLRPQWLEAPRGMILASDGTVLVDNRPSFDLFLVPQECGPDLDDVVERLERLLKIDADELRARIADTAHRPFRRVLVKKDVSKSALIPVEEYSYMLPGVFTVVRPQRRYVHGKTAGQVLGYLGSLAKGDLERLGDAYRPDDLIGRAGIERTYEDSLHGQYGYMLVTRYASGEPQWRTDAYGRPRIDHLIDTFGHELQSYPRDEPVPGKNLVLTLDLDLQQKAEELLRGSVGAIVALNARTGAVLALASSPGYDPSIFVEHGSNADQRKRISEQRGRLLNARKPDPRPMACLAIQENYPPGSVFKVVMAVAALQEGVITPETTFFCPGYFQINNKGKPWECWKKTGHGNVNVVESLAFSCNVFFYNVGLKLGVDRIHLWATRMGLGKRTGIDLAGEVKGLIPSRQWKENIFKPRHPKEPWMYRWYDGETLNLSIGQGYCSTTPLQNAVIMAAIVNGGRIVRPYLNSTTAQKLSDPLIDDTVLKTIQKGMRLCVDKQTAPSGTGRMAKKEGLVILGKTGTAQVVKLDAYKGLKEEDVPYEFRNHALFVAGVIGQEPPLAVAVIIEHGLHGSSAAAPLAGDLIESFYTPERLNDAPASLAANKQGGPAP